jgi:hypothetical protein
MCEGDGNHVQANSQQRRQQPQQPLGFSLPFCLIGALVFVPSWLFLQWRALIDVVEGPAVCWWSNSCDNGAAVGFNVRPLRSKRPGGLFCWARQRPVFFPGAKRWRKEQGKSFRIRGRKSKGLEQGVGLAFCKG